MASPFEDAAILTFFGRGGAGNALKARGTDACLCENQFPNLRPADPPNRDAPAGVGYLSFEYKPGSGQGR